MDGEAVGEREGKVDGEAVGLKVGEAVGMKVGLLEGEKEGDKVGEKDRSTQTPWHEESHAHIPTSSNVQVLQQDNQSQRL